MLAIDKAWRWRGGLVWYPIGTEIRKATWQRHNLLAHAAGVAGIPNFKRDTVPNRLRFCQIVLVSFHGLSCGWTVLSPAPNVWGLDGGAPCHAMQPASRVSAETVSKISVVNPTRSVRLIFFSSAMFKSAW